MGCDVSKILFLFKFNEIFTDCSSSEKLSSNTRDDFSFTFGRHDVLDCPEIVDLRCSFCAVER